MRDVLIGLAAFKCLCTSKHDGVNLKYIYNVFLKELLYQILQKIQLCEQYLLFQTDKYRDIACIGNKVGFEIL